MSGICGIYQRNRSFGPALLEPMMDALALPGESERTWCGRDPVLLGVARRWNFQQAVSLRDVSVVADADLVGYGDLLRTLQLDPGSCPNVAEAIGRLYLQRGMGFLECLHGAFSLALWDEKVQRLLLAVDRFGFRNLYWRSEDSRILFASRPGAIRCVQNDPVSINHQAVLQFLLYASVPAPLSMDRAIARLRPGTYVMFEPERTIERQYWDLQYPEVSDYDISRLSLELREEIRTAVYRQLEGCDAERTGCFLSGGTDSSSVVAFASEKHAPAQSFSVAFQEQGFSEIEFARTAATCFHTRHHEKLLTPQDASSAINRLIAFYDEPFANSSAVGSYHCALLAREKGIDTLLAGDGGDEIFGGNERYARDKYFALYHSLPVWFRQRIVEPTVRLLPESGGFFSLPRRYVRRANIPNPRRILSYNFFLSSPAEGIFEPDFLSQVDNEGWLEIAERHYRTPDTASELNRILYMDVKMTLADNDLRKVSGTAELAGINVRYPLLDDRLVGFSGRIPASLKLKGFEKRYLFKQAMKGILPDKILYKKKHGFGVPLAQWLLNEPTIRDLMLDVMHDQRTRTRGYFRPEFIERLMSLHKRQPNFYGEIVWYLMALELWHRRHFDESRKTIYAG